MSFFLVYRLSPHQNRSSQAEWPGLQLHQTTAVKFLGPPFTVWLQARDSISLCRRLLIYDEGMILVPTSQGPVTLTGDSLAQTLVPREPWVIHPLFHGPLEGSSRPEAPQPKVGKGPCWGATVPLLEGDSPRRLSSARVTYSVARTVECGQCSTEAAERAPNPREMNTQRA